MGNKSNYYKEKNNKSSFTELIKFHIILYKYGLLYIGKTYEKKISNRRNSRYSPKYGGFETLTEYITKDLSEKYDITVFVVLNLIEEKIKKYNNCHLKYINLNANGCTKYSL